MTLAEIITLLTAATGTLAVIFAFWPQLWAGVKVRAEAGTETATTTKVKAEASAILVDSTMALAARLDAQILALIAERDALKKEREELRLERDNNRKEQDANKRAQDLQFLDVHSELSKTQEQLAVILMQFDDCKKKLDLVAFKTGVSSVNPHDAREIN